MRRNVVRIFAVSILVLGASAAQAGCEGRKTTGTVIGAGAGGVLGNVVTHGSVIGTVGGAVVGGLAGHSIAAGNCHRAHYYYHHARRGYYDRYHHWHYV